MLPYPARFVYDIVNGVEAYPDFLPWCGDARLHRADETSLEASIQIKVAGIEHWFKTRNSMVPGESIEIALLEGPFKHLHGRWDFTALGDDACKIGFIIEFEFERGLVAAVIAPVFTKIANTLVDSFCQRAKELHGR